jgi:hypothetical protein
MEPVKASKLESVVKENRAKIDIEDESGTEQSGGVNEILNE